MESKINPFLFSSTNCLQPGTFETNIGLSIDIASKQDFDNPSLYEGKTRQCEFSIKGLTSGGSNTNLILLLILKLER